MYLSNETWEREGSYGYSIRLVRPVLELPVLVLLVRGGSELRTSGAETNVPKPRGTSLRPVFLIPLFSATSTRQATGREAGPTGGQAWVPALPQPPSPPNLVSPIWEKPARVHPRACPAQ